MDDALLVGVRAWPGPAARPAAAARAGRQRRAGRGARPGCRPRTNSSDEVRQARRARRPRRLDDVGVLQAGRPPRPRCGSGPAASARRAPPARIIFRATRRLSPTLPGLVDDAHAAAAQLPQDLVAGHDQRHPSGGLGRLRRREPAWKRLPGPARTGRHQSRRWQAAGWGSSEKAAGFPAEKFIRRRLRERDRPLPARRRGGVTCHRAVQGGEWLVLTTMSSRLGCGYDHVTTAVVLID